MCIDSDTKCQTGLSLTFDKVNHKKDKHFVGNFAKSFIYKYVQI